MSPAPRRPVDGPEVAAPSPAGPDAPAELSFDDTPIEDVVLQHERHGGTPVDVIDAALAGQPLEPGMGPALAAVLNADRDLFAAVCARLGPGPFEDLLGTIWATGGLAPQLAIPVGVWLGFHTEARRHALGASPWADLADIYRGEADAEELHTLVACVLEAIERATPEFWTDAAAATGLERRDAVRLMSALEGTSPADVGEQPAIAIPSLGAVTTACARTMAAQGDAHGHRQLVRWTRICVATALTAAPDHPFVADSLNRIFLLAVRRSPDPRAMDLGRRALEIRRKALDQRHPLVRQSRINLGGAAVLFGDFDAAEALLATPRGTDDGYALGHYWLARLHQARGRTADRGAEAQAWRRFLQSPSPQIRRRLEASTRLRSLES